MAGYIKIFFKLSLFTLVMSCSLLLDGEKEISGVTGTNSGIISGVFIESDRSPITGQKVSLLKSTEPNTIYSNITDSTGSFLFDSLHAGTYTIKASYLGKQIQSSSIVLDTNETIDDVELIFENSSSSMDPITSSSSTEINDPTSSGFFIDISSSSTIEISDSTSSSFLIDVSSSSLADSTISSSSTIPTNPTSSIELSSSSSSIEPPGSSSSVEPPSSSSSIEPPSSSSSIELTYGKIQLSPSNIVADSIGGKELLDEQELAGDPKSGDKILLATNWEPSWDDGDYPLSVVIDLGTLHHITDIYFLDIHSDGQLEFAAGDFTNWTTVATDSQVAYEQWIGHTVDVQTRYVRVSIFQANVSPAEVILYGAEL